SMCPKNESMMILMEKLRFRWQHCWRILGSDSNNVGQPNVPMQTLLENSRFRCKP
ncbi:hypothetical protein J6590_004367, partial [Homalodisca vitripennis]